MLLTTLFIVAKNYKQPIGPSVGDWLDKRGHPIQ
jgi:hypothetical protein